MLEKTVREAFQEGQEKGFGRLIRTFDPDVPGYVFWPIIFGLGAIFGLVVLGGFLGMGNNYYPLPWSVLTYNPDLDGYEFNLTEQQLKNAPKYFLHENWNWSDRARIQEVSHFYGL